MWTFFPQRDLVIKIKYEHNFNIYNKMYFIYYLFALAHDLSVIVFVFVFRMQDGLTALMLTAFNGHPECVKVLLRRGANRERTTNVSHSMIKLFFVK